MTPQIGNMLVNEVVPRLRAAVPSVPKVGADDNEEILADMTATAAAMMDSAERAGKTFTAGNIAWFASRQARTGRRSTGSSRTDVHSPDTQLDGRAHLDHLDGGPDTGVQYTESGDAPDGLHEIVWNGPIDDPAEEAARNLDWDLFIDSHGVIQVPREIAELAVLEHNVSVTTTLTRNRWFGWFPSTLVITGNYSGKLGIDLEKVRGGFDPESGVLELDLPPARVLSIETTGLWRSFEAQSWFTPLAPYEVVELVRRNRAEARDRLEDRELLRAANRRLREQLTAALAGTGVVLRLVEPAG